MIGRYDKDGWHSPGAPTLQLTIQPVRGPLEVYPSVLNVSTTLLRLVVKVGRLEPILSQGGLSPVLEFKISSEEEPQASFNKKSLLS